MNKNAVNHKIIILCFVEYVCQYMFVCLCMFGGLCVITLTYIFSSRLELAVHTQQLYRKIIKHTSDGELWFDSQINTSAFHQCSLVIRTPDNIRVTVSQGLVHKLTHLQFFDFFLIFLILCNMQIQSCHNNTVFVDFRWFL